MSVTQAQIDNACREQNSAAHDLNSTVRLIAGPGTGKSFVIEERVKWLIIDQNIPPEQIIVVSFTRASAIELGERIIRTGNDAGIQNIKRVHVSTLHALALKILRRTGRLSRFPADPIIMDEWEQKNVFDKEYSCKAQISLSRAHDIRVYNEAFWSTGSWSDPNCPPIEPSITQEEILSFKNFYNQWTSLYCCVLAGEVISTCVDGVRNGTLNPVEILNVSHIIIDEVQDLNTCDFQFIESFVEGGANVFISGDDDQSIYSFRYAYPKGILEFEENHPDVSTHTLSVCFRCTVRILEAAKQVLDSHRSEDRIEKNLVSVYSNSNPQNDGVILGKKFNNTNEEMDFIADSCSKLIQNGIPASQIMILLGNSRVLLKPLIISLCAHDVPYDATEKDVFKDERVCRFVLSLIRILKNSDNYVAHRVLLGTPEKSGIKTVFSIANWVIDNNLNYKHFLYNQLSTDVFDNREISTIQRFKSNIECITGWTKDDTLLSRKVDIESLICSNFKSEKLSEWKTYIDSLPDEMTLSEMLEYIETDSQAKKIEIVASITNRTSIDNPERTLAQPQGKVRVLTFHSSKGLSSKIVFLPGLEEKVFPTVRSQAAVGLLLENARLFYVALTRAKAACVLSYSTKRRINGRNERMSISRFAEATEIVFSRPPSLQLTDEEVSQINNSLRIL